MNIKLAIKKKIDVKISVDTGWRVAVEWVINTTTLKKSACQENGGDTNLTACLSGSSVV